MDGEKEFFTFVGNGAKSDDALLEHYANVIGVPKSLEEPNSLNTWQKIDRRGWRDEYEDGFDNARIYVDELP